MYRSIGVSILEKIMLVLAIVYIMPLLLTMMNAFKQLPEFIKPYYTLPEKWSFVNFVEVYKITGMGQAAYNSIFITTISVIGILWIASMASYALVRGANSYTRTLYVLFVAGMILPFHVIMVPSIKLLTFLHLSGRFGLIFMYLALGMSLGVFMFTGFIRSSVPKELEESILMDGATSYDVYWHIVLPILKPVLVTVGMLNTIWIWNDFLLPSLLLTDEHAFTLPVSQFRFVGEYLQQWNYQFAGFTMAIIPLIIIFFISQKYIMKGITAGSLKG